MVCQELFVAEHTMHARAQEHLHQSLRRKQVRQIRRLEANLPYRLGRLLTRWGEQLTQYGHTLQSLPVGDPARGLP